jgi:hypothetical protein
MVHLTLGNDLSHDENVTKRKQMYVSCMCILLCCLRAWLVDEEVLPEEGACLQTKLSDHSAGGASRHGGGDPDNVCVHLAHIAAHASVWLCAMHIVSMNT